MKPYEEKEVNGRQADLRQGKEYAWEVHGRVSMRTSPEEAYLCQTYIIQS
jgi:hypothetical protein